MSLKKSLSQLVTDRRVRVTAVSVLSAVGGAGLSYALTKRHMTLEFEKLLDKELEAARKYYQDLYFLDGTSVKDEPVADGLTRLYSGESQGDGDLSADSDRKMTREEFEASRRNTKVVIDEPKETVRRNTFDYAEKVEEYDLEAEMRKRSADTPYIITQEEFFENEPSYTQVSISYFRGDDVLADEQDDAFQDHSVIGGSDNLRFGYGSNDKNLVYIRNDEIETDFEVTHSYGTFASEVLGLEHMADDRRVGVRKFRDRE